MKRVLCVIVDQLTGHWAEGVKIEGTDLPPVNVAGYHQLGLIPTALTWRKNTLNLKIEDQLIIGHQKSSLALL